MQKLLSNSKDTNQSGQTGYQPTPIRNADKLNSKFSMVQFKIFIQLDQKSQLTAPFSNFGF
jgi:hypothetical protein